VFRRRRFFAGRPIRRGDELRDIAWFSAGGTEMSEQDWETDLGRCVMAFLNGQGIPDVDPRGERVIDDSFLLCFNAAPEDVDMVLPGHMYGENWVVVLDTSTAEVPGGLAVAGGLGGLGGAVGTMANVTGLDMLDGARTVEAKATLTVAARSLVVLQRSERAE
jgi:glycogen operon protein